MRVTLDGRSFGDRQVLAPLDLAFGEREAVAILGPSGVGKTTLLRIIAGLDREAGASIDGAGRVSMVFQEPTLLPWRTARENITIATRCGIGEAEARLAEVGLEGRGSAFPGQLSLGQQRRVALARAFAGNPDTLLLDEPFVSLDQAASRRMQVLLGRLLDAHPARLILVTHSADEAARLASRVLRLGGSPAGIVADEALALPRDERDDAWIARTARALGAASELP